MRKIIFLLALFLGASLVGYSQEKQDSTKTIKIYRITKNDGAKYIGEILSDDGREVLILTEALGKIYIPKSDIQSIKLIVDEEKTVDGNFREVGPFKSRYYFTNNALPITKGEDYAMIHLYGPEVHLALSDRFSLGVMTTWIASPIGLAAKYSIPTKNEKLNFSLGTIMLSSGYLINAAGWGGLHWASVSYGKAGKNMTFSTGYAYIDLGFSRRHNYETGFERMTQASVSSIGAIIPVGKKASFIFDSMVSISERRNYTSSQGFYDLDGNYVPNITTYDSGTEVSSFLMPGMRFQKNDSHAFQVALAGIVQFSSIGFNQSNSSKVRSFPVPMCSWFFKF
jgi:hypothetical protein